MENISRRTVIITVSALLLGSCFFFIKSQLSNVSIATALTNHLVDETNESEDFSQLEESDTNTEIDTVKDSQPEVIYVDIDGAVNNPGVFMVPSGTRLFTLIDVAGGLKEDADTRNINRADEVKDRQKIYIPEINEIYIPEPDVSENYESSSEAGSLNDSKININTASQSQLETLPGIGEVLAQRIIAYRNEKMFSTIEEVMNVSGIANAKYDALKDLITVQ